jgi:hypothetical protein
MDCPEDFAEHTLLPLFVLRGFVFGLLGRFLQR